MNGVDTPSFLLYSGHDDGPMEPVLAAFGVWDGTWPRYAAMMTLELFHMSSAPATPLVRMVYNGQVLHVSAGSNRTSWRCCRCCYLCGAVAAQGNVLSWLRVT